jgi:hypothetical protein
MIQAAGGGGTGGERLDRCELSELMAWLPRSPPHLHPLSCMAHTVRATPQISDARSREMRLLIRNAIIKTINVTVRRGPTATGGDSTKAVVGILCCDAMERNLPSLQRANVKSALALCLLGPAHACAASPTRAPLQMVFGVPPVVTFAVLVRTATGKNQFEKGRRLPQGLFDTALHASAPPVGCATPAPPRPSTSLETPEFLTHFLGPLSHSARSPMSSPTRTRPVVSSSRRRPPSPCEPLAEYALASTGGLLLACDRGPVILDSSAVLLTRRPCPWLPFSPPQALAVQRPALPADAAAQGAALRVRGDPGV